MAWRKIALMMLRILTLVPGASGLPFLLPASFDRLSSHSSTATDLMSPRRYSPQRGTIHLRK